MKVISTDELKDRIHHITLIDVRNPYEYEFGHIQGAEDIPLEHLEDGFKNRYTTEEKDIVIYGEDEEMGTDAAKKLEDIGYNNVEVYQEGFQEWRRSKLPIKRVSLGQERRTRKI
ncbi:MAG: hypothetical protein A2Y25_00155 [Candidatus Melainabacteria bacterium GWF2_37_15]|nr:MAG: hypothetical protein A2Y25_00155 [Candidatus Melainabacteria bacterium GWF2_37_15]